MKNNVVYCLTAVLLLAGCGGGGSTASSSTASGSIPNSTPATTSTTTTAATPVSNPVTYGQAMISWVPPLQNTDGSMLTDLIGYNVYYGTDPKNLTLAVQLDCNWCVWTNLSNLSAGTWYFAVKSYNELGVESELSTLTSKTSG